MTDNQANSSLDPTAATFTMNSSLPVNGNATDSATPKTNGQSQDSKGKGKNPDTKAGTTAKDTSEAGAGVKLTGAELKKQKAAEKALRRAEKVVEKGGPTVPQAVAPTNSSTATNRPDMNRRPSTSRATGDRPRRDSVSGGGRNLPLRPGGQASAKETTPPQETKLDKRIPMLTHLYSSTSSRRASLASAGREIHPAVLTLGLQLRDYVICGANARTVATLLVFKKVIQAYSTPAGVALPRHLTTHLSHQISYLSLARPLNVAQGNSIRWLKKLISALDPDLAENDAKSFLCGAIDSFIREKITLADEVIAKEATGRLEEEGEVILTYGKSSVVEKTLLTAWRSGKKFKVVVVDSRPLFEGRNLARSLIRAGMKDVKYCLLTALADIVETEGVTKCILGASAMFGNGRLISRAGTAMVAMMAKEGGNGGSQGKGKVPVIVLCESVKFTAKVALDSLSTNEVGDADALVEREPSKTITHATVTQQKPEPLKKGGGKPTDDVEEKKEHKGLEGWRDQPNLYLMNLMYDVTPAEYLDMVISELGSLPPSAVPVVNGVHGGDE